MLTKTPPWMASIRGLGILAGREERQTVKGDKVGVGVVSGHPDTALLT